MGLMDKIKNALFEVEYEDEEEAPKKEKKKEEKENKPIAKRIVLPGKKEEKVEEIQEEELKDEDFEIRPKEEPMMTREEFKILNDNDFKMDDYNIEEPEIVEVLPNEEEVREPEVVEEVRVEREVYPEVKEEYHETYRENNLYGMNNSYDVPVHPYGTYEKKEEKGYFRPSPIISPIYGILDKNYKKEDVKEKREVHISSYTRNNLSVDDIRKKAYGEEKKTREERIAETQPTKFEVEEEENVLVDLSDRAKPEVKEITMGDAVEYFQDLGLEYNVDYVDTSTDRNARKAQETKVEEPKVEETPVVEKRHEEEPEEKKEDLELTKDLEDTMGIPVQEAENEEKTDNVGDDTNDNLFDLIDSMYQEKE